MRDLVDDKNVKVDALLLQEVVHVRYELVQLGRHVPKRHQDPKPVLPRFDRPAVQKRVQLQFRVDVPAAAVTRTHTQRERMWWCMCVTVMRPRGCQKNFREQDQVSERAGKIGLEGGERGFAKWSESTHGIDFVVVASRSGCSRGSSRPWTAVSWAARAVSRCSAASSATSCSSLS